MRRSDIPVGTGFSPNLYDLRGVLRAIIAHSGNREDLENAFWSSSTRKKPHPSKPSDRAWRLPMEAAVQCGLLTAKTYMATELARELAEEKDDRALYVKFARHILLNLNGLAVVEAVEEMNKKNNPVTSDSLATYLTNHKGISVPVHNTRINTMRMRLSKAGIFPGSKHNAWKVNREALNHVLGVGIKGSDVADLDEEQRAFVRSLCAINP
jgi:hypothetical protein